MRWLSGDGLAFRGRRIASADGGANVHISTFRRSQRGAELGQRFLQVLVDVVTQGLQRRNINYMRLILQRPVEACPEQQIEFGEKSSQSFPRASRCSNQRVRPGLDGRPAQTLRFSGRAKFLLEPTPNDRMELKGLHRCNLHRKRAAST